MGASFQIKLILFIRRNKSKNKSRVQKVLMDLGKGGGK